MSLLNISILILVLILFAKHLMSLHISDDVRFIKRQERKDYLKEDSETQNTAATTNVEKYQFLSNFVLLHEKYLLEYNETCNIDLHTEWTDPVRKSVLSGGKDSFQMNITWRHNICNFFKYLDCVHEPGLLGNKGICRCASQEKVGMKLYFDPFIKYENIFAESEACVRKTPKYKKNKKQFRFYCRANEGGLCGFVRLLPNKTIPGIDFAYPDIFPCLTYPYDDARDNVTSKFHWELWKGRKELSIEKKGLICDHRQLNEADVRRLKKEDPEITQGLDFVGEKIHASLCRKKVEGE